MSRAEITKIITKNTMAPKVYRSRKDKVLFGVCGGFAKYLDIDSTLLRLAAAFLGLCYGAGIVLYLISAIIIPNEPIAPEEVQE